MEIVHIRPIDHINRVDEELRPPHDLQEVPRPLQLRHELDEELRARVGVDALHQADDGAHEAVVRRRDAAVGHDGRVRPVVARRHGRAARGRAGGAGLGGGVVGRAVRDDAHRDEHDEEVEDDGPVGDPREAGERADLAHGEAGEGPDEAADAVAEAELGYLRDGLAGRGCMLVSSGTCTQYSKRRKGV